ncbi:MAG: pyruvate ferredoxin oxidoreductase [Betaproteobacteria bacterium]|jgi:pyruvate ferredoxin oxidoreductase alpha subunit|nr:pyruvate ferredoxin oxidoreductase [Betaproteobacteria bacterium]MBK7081909.1 pyruvate ferredoxin oxidoreductase [Betaproteobacteria bacterium]MBK8690673.1 pyruvate ferredoxin oxidoreductase [Betaproteobacteria bacterium]MBK9675110.1 pyruvate ferredoxin oxidoreductase [Betaproteobacteria bacterium]
MLKQVEGSHAVAEAIALSRPQIICAYPITPQTHIVEGVGEMVKDGTLKNCEFINVESEFAALSVAIGASAAGARTYTATSSQGLLFMAEAVYNAAGLGLPIVMTIGNRAIGAPINIWNDHSDSMSMRDAGWIQLFAETNQEALDLHIQAFRLAEELSCPVMVCMDGFILTHAYDRVDVPSQEEVDAFLPPFEPRQILDPSAPVTMGAMVGPEAFTEVRYLAHHKQLRALTLIPQLSAEFEQRFGRASGGLIREYCTEGAETIVVSLGSINGTVQEVVDDMRADGAKIGSVSICSFRPFPLTALRDALQNAKRVVVLEKCLAVGLGGIVSDGVRKSLSGIQLKGYTVIAGLGGRAITRGSLRQLFEDAAADELEQVTFLDLNADVVAYELERESQARRTGPTAEAILKRLGTVSSKIG